MALSTVGLLVTIGTAVDNRNRNKRAEAKAEERAKVDRAMAADASARKRRQQIREQNIAKARIENMAAAQGAQQSSAVIASAANVTSMASENIGQINTTLGASKLSANLEKDIFKLQQPSDFSYAADIFNSVNNRFLKASVN